jgi:3-isopropylmalate/(R)-2-methylmalate dehydratase large subunit
MSVKPLSLFEKIWRRHIVEPETPDVPAVLYVDLHLVHEVSSPQAFSELRDRGLAVRRPQRTLATLDHATPTVPVPDIRHIPLVSDAAANQIRVLQSNCAEFGVPIYDLQSDRRGIVHVIAPEQGLTRPGMTIVCGDSHTSTHGAFGALAFGIGTTEVAHVLATQCLMRRKPKAMAINVSGNLGPAVSAKDLILSIIGEIGVGGGIGHVIEFRGEAIYALSMEQRMTVCNMSIEAGARAGLIAPDKTTFEYLAGRPGMPSGADWQAMIEDWKTLPTDPQAQFDRTVDIDISDLAPLITFGTHPGMVIPIDGRVPDDPGDESLSAALEYMQLTPGEPLAGHRIDVAFVGSCTNSRISDLREAASMLTGRKVANGVRMLVVPGSQAVKRQAEAEGLDRVFLEAGAEWRESGCSMCIAMNGDIVEPGQYAISTSNRNFQGRQGTGARTLLASPLTTVASAITGVVTDPRELTDGR